MARTDGERSEWTRRQLLGRAGLVGGALALGAPLLSACGSSLSGGTAPAASATKAAAATASAAKSGGGFEWKIGIVESLSGPYAIAGDNEMHGMQLAIMRYNAKGGVCSHKVTSIHADDGTKPDVSQQKFREFATKDQVDAEMGDVSSGDGEAMSSAAQQLGVLYFGSGTHSDTLTGTKANKMMFRTTSSNTMLARTVGKFLLDEGKRWYFVTADYSWGISGEVAFKAVLKKAGGTVVGVERTPLGTTDFSSQLTRIKGTDAQVVIASLYGSDLVHFLKQWHSFGMGKKMQVGGPLNGQEITAGLTDAENVGYWGAPWMPDNGAPGSKQFAADIKKNFNEDISWRHWCGYAAAVACIEAFSRAKSSDPKKLVATLEGQGQPNGKFSFDVLKKNPAWIRSWDHQAIQEVYAIQSIPKKEWTMPNQYFKMVGSEPGEAVARTKEENAAAAKRIASQTVPNRAGYTIKSC